MSEDGGRCVRGRGKDAAAATEDVDDMHLCMHAFTFNFLKLVLSIITSNIIKGQIAHREKL